jgi:hypothetical protein
MQETTVEMHHMAMDSPHGKDGRQQCSNAYENSPRHLREEEMLRDPKQRG